MSIVTQISCRPVKAVRMIVYGSFEYVLQRTSERMLQSGFGSSGRDSRSGHSLALAPSCKPVELLTYRGQANKSKHADFQEEQIEKKMAVIVDANAVVNPGTMAVAISGGATSHQTDRHTDHALRCNGRTFCNACFAVVFVPCTRHSSSRRRTSISPTVPRSPPFVAPNQLAWARNQDRRRRCRNKSMCRAHNRSRKRYW